MVTYVGRFMHITVIIALFLIEGDVDVYLYQSRAESDFWSASETWRGVAGINKH